MWGAGSGAGNADACRLGVTLAPHDGRIYTRGDHRVIGHDGVTHGFTAFLEWYPDDDLVVAYAGNIRTSAYEYLEDALPALAFDEPLVPVDRPSGAHAGRDTSVVGSYRVHDALVLDVALLDGGLELRGSGGYFTPLLQVEGDRYWYPALYAAVEFQRDAAGNAVGMSWRTVQGQTFEIPRIVENAHALSSSGETAHEPVRQ